MKIFPLLSTFLQKKKRFSKYGHRVQILVTFLNGLIFIFFWVTLSNVSNDKHGCLIFSLSYNQQVFVYWKNDPIVPKFSTIFMVNHRKKKFPCVDLSGVQVDHPLFPDLYLSLSVDFWSYRKSTLLRCGRPVAAG